MTGKCQEILNQLKYGNPNHILVPRNKFKWIWFSLVVLFEMDKIMKKNQYPLALFSYSPLSVICTVDKFWGQTVEIS